ncbi:hypothetical protein H0H81_010217 [Sphagnurus paluster]|uniref:Uncharacterized protein n=1 Tax=Sphagnurus paluster TaxID=117069 RepID=A0A9P7FR56_9AGAR|nr:hypothetical protein H0H81_010217 [Sphagnurus paluster]
MKRNLEGTTLSYRKRIVVRPLESNTNLSQQSPKRRSDDFQTKVFVYQWNGCCVLLLRAMFSGQANLFHATISEHIKDHARDAARSRVPTRKGADLTCRWYRRATGARLRWECHLVGHVHTMHVATSSGAARIFSRRFPNTKPHIERDDVLQALKASSFKLQGENPENRMVGVLASKTKNYPTSTLSTHET